MEGPALRASRAEIPPFPSARVSRASIRSSRYVPESGNAGRLSQIPEDVGERRRAEERHADGLEVVRLMDRVDRHDVGVLQLGERSRFVEQLRGRSSTPRGGRPTRPAGPGRRGRRRLGPARRAGESRGTRSPTRGIAVTAWASRLATTGSERWSSSKTSAWSELPSKPSQDGLPAAPSGSAWPRHQSW